MEEKKSYLLITRYLSNHTSIEENEELTDWIEASTQNEQTFEEIKSIWTAVKETEDSTAYKALSKLKQQINQNEKYRNPVIWTSRKWYAFAASVITGLIVSVFYYYSSSNLRNINYLKQVTNSGQKKSFYLEDGTKVFLAPQSTLKYPDRFEAGNRTVSLDGEAYFEVSKNPHKPFVVHTSTLNVQVLGTHFNVNGGRNQNLTVVSLLEGKVRVTLVDDTTEAYLLHPGQELSLDHITHQIYQHDLDSATVTSWMTNTLVFKNEKLEDAAKKIEHLYGVKIIFADQATSEIRLYAVFKNEPLKDVMETIRATGPIVYRLEGKKVYLMLKSNKENPGK